MAQFLKISTLSQNSWIILHSLACEITEPIETNQPISDLSHLLSMDCILPMEFDSLQRNLFHCTMHACTHALSCPPLWDSMDCSPPASSIHGIFQARILEWIAISHSRGSSQPRDRTNASCISCIGKGVLYQLCHLGSLYFIMDGS